MHRHPGKLAWRPQARPERLRPQGKAAAGAWGVAAPGELRGCAGCEPGARATDVAWACATRALARRGARFGALSAPFLRSHPLPRTAGRGAVLGWKGPGWGCSSPGAGTFWTRSGEQDKGVKRDTRSPRRGIWKRAERWEERERKNGQQNGGTKQGLGSWGKRETAWRTSCKIVGRCPRRKDWKQEESSRNGEEG